ncbi:hypothetical protein D3C87_1784260 [compost metagenome]
MLVERHEAETFRVEVELDAADWTVTVFSDNEVGDILTLRLGVVVRFAVDKHNDVGILLD